MNLPHPNPLSCSYSICLLPQHIFDKIALADNVQYLVRASYLEIYNEEIRDLLSKVIRPCVKGAVKASIPTLPYPQCFLQSKQTR